MRNHCVQFQCLVCVFLCRRVRLPMFRAAVESTDCERRLIHAGSSVRQRCWQASCAPRRAARAPISDQESYPYRIGTVHMCRDAAYADAGVRPGAFMRTSSVANFPGVALDV